MQHWVSTIRSQVHFTEDTVLIAHSYGTLAVQHVLETLDTPVYATVLVSPISDWWVSDARRSRNTLDSFTDYDAYRAEQ